MEAGLGKIEVIGILTTSQTNYISYFLTSWLSLSQSSEHSLIYLSIHLVILEFHHSLRE